MSLLAADRDGPKEDKMVTEASATITTAGCPTAMKFDGKKESWPAYKLNFDATARYLNLGGTLRSSHMDRMPESDEAYDLLDETDPEDKKKIVAF